MTEMEQEQDKLFLQEKQRITSNYLAIKPVWEDTPLLQNILNAVLEDIKFQFCQEDSDPKELKHEVIALKRIYNKFEGMFLEYKNLEAQEAQEEYSEDE